MLLQDLVATSRRVASTPARLAKRRAESSSPSGRTL